MDIPSYKVHNVLKVYSEQLRQKKFAEQTPIIKSIDKSSEGKRQAIIKKVAGEIFERIISSGIHEKVDNEITDERKEKRPKYTEKEKNEFVFNKIDNNNKKSIGRLLISDASVLIKQPEEMEP
ncbi:MAG: hypothetical protein KKD50_07010 [Proteobacteria bacterium]|nr:hypothetical protein [Pseudomonadota bacterium]